MVTGELKIYAAPVYAYKRRTHRMEMVSLQLHKMFKSTATVLLACALFAQSALAHGVITSPAPRRVRHIFAIHAQFPRS